MQTFAITFDLVEIDGSTYPVPQYAKHRPAPRRLLAGKLYEPQTHDFVASFGAKFDGSMIHAGTFFGDMLPTFARSATGDVFAFEPVIENHILAQSTVKLNNLENVVLFNAALSESLGALRIQTRQPDGKHSGGGSAIAATGDICAAIAVDLLKIPDLILIHLDVEGYELPVLRGARETIEQHRPVILIEDNLRNCEPLLSDMQYRRAGSIPGLNIWTPREREPYRRHCQTWIRNRRHSQ